MHPSTRIACFLILLSAGLPAFAQPATPAPAAPPAAPPTAARERFVVQIPAGFEKLAIGGHTALCEPADVEWVKKALTTFKPATRPTTMPSDLLKRATDSRNTLVARLTSELALPDDKAAADFYDNKLLPALKKFNELSPPIYFLVVTKARLDKLVQSGWGEPRFHYNRLASTTSYDDNVMVAADRPMDDSVLPAFYTEKETPEERIKKLGEGVAELDAKLANLISGQTQLQVFNLFAEHIGTTTFEPLKLRRDQLWFALGSSAYLATAYASAITGISRDFWLHDITLEVARQPISSRGIDLINPLEEARMRPGASPHYTQAMRRKATAAIITLTTKAGDPAIGKVLTAIRKQLPADGAALVTLIKDVTGADVSKELEAK